MSKKRKPFVIIRRSGYYINAIINDEKVIRAWKENNIPQPDPNVEPYMKGVWPRRTVDQAVRETFLSFTPASALQVKRAKAYAPEYKNKYGLLR